MGVVLRQRQQQQQQRHRRQGRGETRARASSGSQRKWGRSDGEKYEEEGMGAGKKMEMGKMGRKGMKKEATTTAAATSAAAPAAAAAAAAARARREEVHTENVLSIILGGGAGSRLYPLTKKRAKPAVPLGANYRLIDIPVSNCINSAITKIYCLTQYNSASLNRHISQAYAASLGGYNRSARGFVEVLAAQQSPENPSWFQGTADAVRQYLWLFEQAVQQDGIEDYIILSGDHLYRMDYRDFIKAHRDSGADITVAALPMDERRASAFGLMKIDETGRIVDFAEKPQGEALKNFAVDTTILGLDAERAKEMPHIASMGIYVFKASSMLELLTEKFRDATDFGGEVIPGANTVGMHVQAYLFDGYWEDIGTIEAFYKANLGLTDSPSPSFSFYDRDAPIYTQSRFLPPSKMTDCEVTHSIIGDGCVIQQSVVKHSVIGLRALIKPGCVIEDSLIMGADFYEEREECEVLPGCLPIGISSDTVVRKAIIDKNARIGANVQILNKEGIQETFDFEDQGYVIRDGIITIIKDAIIPDGTVI